MKKKARGMFALVEGDCEWVIFSGRNYKVLLFLSSDVLDLILRLFSARPNLFVGHVPNSALYSKWYFEVAIDHVEQMSSMTPHFRVGWGNTKGYVFLVS